MLAPLTVTLAFCPLQIPVDPENESVGFGFTLNAKVAVLPEQPAELLPIKL